MRSILVVEDDPDIRELLVDLLGCDGFDAHGAMHGREALERLEAGLSPDLILTDLMMPIMDGWELHAALERNPRWARIPIVVLSASLPPNRTPAFGTFLSKPVDLDRLTAVIRSQMSAAVPSLAAGG